LLGWKREKTSSQTQGQHLTPIQDSPVNKGSESELRSIVELAFWLVFNIGQELLLECHPSDGSETGNAIWLREEEEEGGGGEATV